MDDKKREMVEMTAEEKELFAQYKADKEKKLEAERKKEELQAYKELVDETVDSSCALLMALRENMADAKVSVMRDFGRLIEMKRNAIGVKTEQNSFTFTNSTGDKRITVGNNTIDAYRDTVEDGIKIVNDFLQSLVEDPKHQALIAMVSALLAKDKKGNLKASRVLQLRRIAEKEAGYERLLQGIKLIEDSYQPTISKQYIRLEVKDEFGEMQDVPLSLTNV